jgi:hypothetical protein
LRIRVFEKGPRLGHTRDNTAQVQANAAEEFRVIGAAGGFDVVLGPGSGEQRVDARGHPWRVAVDRMVVRGDRRTKSARPNECQQQANRQRMDSRHGVTPRHSIAQE